MSRKLLTLIVCAICIVSINAQDSTFRTAGFEQPIMAHWNGNYSELKHSVRFCLKFDDSSQTDNQYTLKLLDLNGGKGNFIARHHDSSIPLKLTISGSGGTETILPGRDSQPLGKDAFCKGSERNLLLQITARKLEEVVAGEYQADIQITASNEQYSSIADQTLRIIIDIPELISIHGDSHINLQGFQNLKSEASLCVYRNGGGTYNLKAEGLKNTQGQFELSAQGSASTPPLLYQINIKSGSSSYQSASPGVLIHNLTGSKTNNCREGNNLKVQIVIPDSIAQKASAGTYQGQLKITVAIQ